MTSSTKIEKKINFQPLTIKSHVYTMNMCALKLGNLGMCTGSIYKLFTWRYLPIFGIWGITLTVDFFCDIIHINEEQLHWVITACVSLSIPILSHFTHRYALVTIHFIFLQNCRRIPLLQIVLLSGTLKSNWKRFRIVYNRNSIIFSVNN